MLSVIYAYRYLIAPVLGPHCRFYPSCSCYSLTAIHQHGCIRGGWLALKRLSRCHPWAPGGVDFVPNSPTTSETET